MRILSEKLKKSLTNSVQNLTTCLLITQTNGCVTGFTTNDHEIIFENIKYKPSKNFFDHSAISNSSSSFDGYDIEGILTSKYITKSAILRGDYNHAKIEIFFLDLSDNIFEKISLKKGVMGEIRVQDKKFYAEVKPTFAKANDNIIGEFFSPLCRAKFGDNRCKIDLCKYAKIVAIMKHDNNKFILEEPVNLAEFRYGTLNILDTNGVWTPDYMINEICDNGIYLREKFSKIYPPKTTIKLTMSCNKSFAACIKYDNAVNFRGEPHLPGGLVVN